MGSLQQFWSFCFRHFSLKHFFSIATTQLWPLTSHVWSPDLLWSHLLVWIPKVFPHLVPSPPRLNHQKPLSSRAGTRHSSVKTPAAWRWFNQSPTDEPAPIKYKTRLLRRRLSVSVCTRWYKNLSLRINTERFFAGRLTKLNRTVFRFNDQFYGAVLLCAAQGELRSAMLPYNQKGQGF